MVLQQFVKVNAHFPAAMQRPSQTLSLQLKIKVINIFPHHHLKDTDYLLTDMRTRCYWGTEYSMRYSINPDIWETIILNRSE